MAQSPEELRREIEQTREDMSQHVDALSDKVSPSRIVHRRVDATKSAAGSVRDKVMGSASAGSDKIGATQSTLSDAVSGAPDAARSRTQGNPLAAGLLAFASGMLLASLLPASKVEEDAVLTLEDKFKEPVKEQLSGIASDLKDELQGSAQDAVQSVKETATEAAQTVGEQGKDSAQTVQSQAKGAADEVRGSTGDGTA